MKTKWTKKMDNKLAIELQKMSFPIELEENEQQIDQMYWNSVSNWWKNDPNWFKSQVQIQNKNVLLFCIISSSLKLKTNLLKLKMASLIEFLNNIEKQVVNLLKFGLKRVVKRWKIGVILLGDELEARQIGGKTMSYESEIWFDWWPMKGLWMIILRELASLRLFFGTLVSVGGVDWLASTSGATQVFSELVMREFNYWQHKSLGRNKKEAGKKLMKSRPIESSHGTADNKITTTQKKKRKRSFRDSAPDAATLWCFSSQEGERIVCVSFRLVSATRR